MDKKFEIIETQTKTSFKAKTNEILSAVNKFANDTEKRFNSIEKCFDRIEGRMDNLDGRTIQTGASMVTKDYLDEKILNFKREFLVGVSQKEICFTK